CGRLAHKHALESKISSYSYPYGVSATRNRFIHALSLMSITAPYVSLLYQQGRIRAQLNKNATSILCKMQDEHRDQEPNERHAQERQAGRQRRVPQLRNLSLPHRQSIADDSPAQTPSYPRFLAELNPPS